MRRNLNVYKRGVLTIEAALVIPVFLMAMAALLSFANVYYVRARIDAAVCEEAKRYAIKSHDKNAYGVGGIEASIEERLGRRFLEAGAIVGGADGLDYSETDITNDEIAKICVTYDVRIPFAFAGFSHIGSESEMVVHTWTGFKNGLYSYGDLSEYVYITDNAEVYHRTRECSHIRLHIISIDRSELKTMRNSDGSKYRQCEYCRPKTKDKKLYITDDGDKYHNTLMCMGLKRTVYRVRLSDITGTKPCSRCGY